MASLHLPCATTANSAPPRSSSSPFFAKPSHFITHSKRNNRLRVTCADAQNPKDIETSEGKVDRRNMLLGLGGLYGAANLASTPAASANPIKPAELDKCGCIFKYNTAIDHMRRLPKDDPRSFMQQANIHCAYCNGAYNQPGQGTLDLQRILGKLIGDPTFALPFWNWDNPKGMTIPPMFVDPKSALYDEKRNQANLPPAVVDLGMTGNTDPLQVVAINLTIMYSEMICGNSDAYDFMGNPYREGTPVNPGPGASERGSHTAVHVWVGDPRQPSGEDLGNFYSAGRDPLFYCHHGNVDRMWSLWQYFLPSNKVPDKRITDPDFLNAAFLFYVENAQLVRVTVKDCLDNLRMGYDYERIDLPWLDYRPPPQTVAARVTRTGKSAPKAETVFPLTLDKIVRILVPKTKKGKADQLLVI
ncbi:Catechol oxidase [Handroanthus impetiginosus]|uniref:Catechol oxidase n=1 Tax=Handroanthus impetiginosus TaxID=429701 RepID=A0A2G9H9E5_9LAMI|nr:Catechol oxidase [Handroanthus impetiginosus]